MKSAFAKRESRSGYIFAGPAALFMFALVIYPMAYGIFISTQRTNLLDEWEFVGAMAAETMTALQESLKEHAQQSIVNAPRARPLPLSAPARHR